jgi:hypothetical protein
MFSSAIVGYIPFSVCKAAYNITGRGFLRAKFGTVWSAMTWHRFAPDSLRLRCFSMDQSADPDMSGAHSKLRRHAFSYHAVQRDREWC